MANKQSALRNKKAEKRKASSKQKQKQANVARNLGAKAPNGFSSDNLMSSVASEGIKATALRIQQGLRKSQKKDPAPADEINNNVVMQNITNVFPSIVRLHAGVELFEILALKEHRFEITPEQDKLIKELDERIIWVLEDVNCITQFIEDGKAFEDYSEVYLHLAQILAQIASDSQDQILEMLVTQKEVIDQYAVEHMGNKPVYAYQHELHGLRVLRVGPAYATQLAAEFALAKAASEHGYTPDSPQELDPVEGVDDGPVLTVEPNLEHDVEQDRVTAPDLATEQPQ